MAETRKAGTITVGLAAMNSLLIRTYLTKLTPDVESGMRFFKIHRGQNEVPTCEIFCQPVTYK